MVLKTQSLVFKWEAPCFHPQNQSGGWKPGSGVVPSFSLVLQTAALLPSGLSPGDFHPRKRQEFKMSPPKCSHF